LKFFEKKNLIIVALIILLILLVCGWWNKYVQLSDYQNQLTKFELSEQKFIEKNNENGEKIIEQEQLILTQKQAIAHQLIEIDNWKKIKSKVIIRTNTLIDSVLIPFTDTIIDTIWHTDSLNNFISIPKNFELINPHYTINGKVLKNGVQLDTFALFNKSEITIGYKKNGFFKKSLPIVELKNSNPYILTDQLNNVIINDNKKWWQKNSTWFTIGVGATIGTILILR